MSKAIFSLFCIAALFNSGMVSGYELDQAKLTELCNKAADKAGDGVNALGTYVQGLTKQGQEQLNKYIQVQIHIPCDPAMLSRRKSSGDPPETLRGGVSGFFGLNHW